MYGRGAADDKGALAVFASVIDAFQMRSGELPFNVRFLFEGEEEVLSPHIIPLIQARPEIFLASLKTSAIPLSLNESKTLTSLESDTTDIGKQIGILPTTRQIAATMKDVVQSRLRPSIHIAKMTPTAPPGAVVSPSASMVLSLRLPPQVAPEIVTNELREFFSREIRAKVRVEQTLGMIGWRTEPDHPLMDLMGNALAAGSGLPSTYYVPVGGTIGILDPVLNATGNAPIFMLGMGDPLSNVHGPNESIPLSSLRANRDGLILFLDSSSRKSVVSSAE